MNQTAIERELIEYIVKCTDVLLQDEKLMKAYETGNYGLLHDEMITHFCHLVEKNPVIAIKIVQGLLRQSGAWRVLWYMITALDRKRT